MASRRRVFAATSPNPLRCNGFAVRQNARENLFCRENFWAGRGNVRFLGPWGIEEPLNNKGGDPADPRFLRGKAPKKIFCESLWTRKADSV
jgi:hypothetical protein